MLKDHLRDILCSLNEEVAQERSMAAARHSEIVALLQEPKSQHHMEVRRIFNIFEKKRDSDPKVP